MIAETAKHSKNASEDERAEKVRPQIERLLSAAEDLAPFVQDMLQRLQQPQWVFTDVDLGHQEACGSFASPAEPLIGFGIPPESPAGSAVFAFDAILRELSAATPEMADAPPLLFAAADSTARTGPLAAADSTARTGPLIGFGIPSESPADGAVFAFDPTPRELYASAYPQ